MKKCRMLQIGMPRINKVKDSIFPNHAQVSVKRTLLLKESI
jgi:hypothetical protein